MLLEILLFIFLLICLIVLSIKAYFRYRSNTFSPKNLLFIGMGWVVLIRFGAEFWVKIQLL